MYQGRVYDRLDLKYEIYERKEKKKSRDDKKERKSRGGSEEIVNKNKWGCEKEIII